MELTTPYAAIRWLEAAIGVSLLIQTFEFLRIPQATAVTGVWSWPVQRADLAHAQRWLRSVFDVLFDARVHHAHLLLRVVAAASLLLGGSALSIGFLFVGTVVILIRWRGAFNGGSDFMTIVVLSGLLIAHLAAGVIEPNLAWRAGLWYVCIHAVTSYFISGAIKLCSPNWRSGHALTTFLDGGLYGPLPVGSLLRHPRVAQLCAWAFILWECCFPLALVGPDWAIMWCAVAAIFHLLVFRFFGLNRFFWAWVASFPAIIHCAGQW
jgi:hypothetical protein